MSFRAKNVGPKCHGSYLCAFEAKGVSTRKKFGLKSDPLSVSKQMLQVVKSFVCSIREAIIE